MLPFVFILVILSFVVFYQFYETNVKTAKKYTENDILDSLRSDLQPVASVLNALYDSKHPILHQNIKYVNFLVGRGRSLGACEIEVVFENLNNKIPPDEEMHKLAFEIRKIVQDFFDEGLVLPDDKSKEKYFEQSPYSKIELQFDNKFYYKDLVPTILCEHCLKYRLELLTFIMHFKYNDRVFYSDFFGVSSMAYKQAIKEFNKRLKAYIANEKHISNIERELWEMFPALKSYFEGSFYWLSQEIYHNPDTLFSAARQKNVPVKAVLCALLFFQISEQMKVPESVADVAEVEQLHQYLQNKLSQYQYFATEPSDKGK